MLVYVDGKLVPKEEAKVSVFDHGFLYGDGVFEGIRVYEGNVFRLEEHMERLYESAKTIRLTIPLSYDELTQATLDTIAAKNAVAYTAATRLDIVSWGYRQKTNRPVGKRWQKETWRLKPTYAWSARGRSRTTYESR